ncbi:glycoside hydrolase family protein [Paenibacillus albus]|uniref:Uncharacterized protein n=1 Tax=Paenibacillus albus TaxID=2495582 RepID=A0A3Q8X981_9BACL|nr:hypothetical protein [Paenibacillus albus]AZN41711.1 hypothetical protein EJC50_20060 [Paenibacillus albus]
MSVQHGGWTKFDHNPVLGGDYGTCFDLTMIREEGVYRMWFSWRPKSSIALVESVDGVHWSEPVIVLEPNKATGWEDDLNRPSVVKREDGYHMWYTGQMWRPDRSCIGYATSEDGIHWVRQSERPVMEPQAAWEKVAVMCPHVEWDELAGAFRMWYSAGDQYEPNAIGYATSTDGHHWAKHEANPVFDRLPEHAWEQHKVTACQVIPYKDGYAMFYIGFRDEDYASIGLAWSKDGISDWKRHPLNPLLSPEHGKWDAEANYKPFAIFDGESWKLWYNGRSGHVEQIGMAVHEGYDLGI